MKIIFLGFMGSGKTSAALRLSRYMEIPFTDLDEYIEEKEGRSVSEIFNQSGEVIFRKKETECLRELLHNPGSMILALGGGTPCRRENMDLIKGSGISVYLKTSPISLAIRLKGAKSKRPLISDVPDEELEGFIRDLLEKREPWYLEADIVFKGENLDVKKLAEVIRNYSK